MPAESTVAPYSITELIEIIAAEECLSLPIDLRDLKAMGVANYTYSIDSEGFDADRQHIPEKRGGHNIELVLLPNFEGWPDTKKLRRPFLSGSTYWAAIGSYFHNGYKRVFCKSICTEQDLIQELIKLKTPPTPSN